MNIQRMSGQWIGHLTGTNTGTINLDFDERRSRYEGVAYVAFDDQQMPSIFCVIKSPDKSETFSVRIDDFGFVHNGAILTKIEAQEFYPHITLPDLIDSDWKINEREITVQWCTNIGTNGHATLTLNDGDKPSLRKAEEITCWSDFKRYVANCAEEGVIYRGQENRTWRLRTAFHREGRANVYRFANEDIRALYKNLSNLTEHQFDLDKPDDFGAFVSLAQHHGYPTPLLDWTYSPFIAAYFAFDNSRASSKEEKAYARVHAFDKDLWTGDFLQVQSLKHHTPHFSVLEPLALNNPRMIPQQALATVTNVADIETYISECEAKSGKIYLRVFDLPMSERGLILKELRMMGITAGSLFPGLDGACRQVRDQMFEIY